MRTRTFAGCFVVFAAFAFLTGGAARAQTPPNRSLYAGPLPVRLRDGISGAAYAVEPRGGAVLSKGASDGFYNLDIGNTSFELLGDGFNALREDSETQNHRIGYRRGLGGGWEAGATFAFATRNGGITDKLIDRWHHDVLHYSDVFRESYPNKQTFIQLTDGVGNQRVSDAHATAQTQTLAFEGRKSIWDTSVRRPEHPVQASARFGLKIPLRDQQAAYYLDNGSVDAWAGLSVSGRARGKLWLHADANVVWAGTGRVLAFSEGKRFLPQAVLAAEYKAGAKTSLLIQTENALYLFPLDLPNHSGRRAQTTFGLWQGVGNKTQLFGAISENIWGPRVTSYAPDVMLSFGIRQGL